MNCFHEEQIQPYLDNECGVEEKAAIEKHLETCSLCRDALAMQHRRMQEAKQSLDLLPTQQPAIPEFRYLKKTHPRRKMAVKYIWPLAVAASLLLIVLLRPLFEADKTFSNGHSVTFLLADELDANKPVTEYPFTITVVAPDGSITQTIIN